MSKPPSFNFTELPKNILEMEKEMSEEEKKIEEENLKTIADRNAKARQIIKKFSQPIIIELDDIEFKLKPITVSLWDEVEGDKESPAIRTKVVKDSLISPELSDEEFNTLPGGLKYKLYMLLLQDFFLMAGRVKIKPASQK